ncbi:MAG: hypothetical protein U9R79_11025 [Armatimonadota bacterium]|nr:hypothetical protein [Armatimonadota bacterium]
MMIATAAVASHAAADYDFTEWPPMDYFVASLVDDIPAHLEAYHPETGRFGTEPWVCRDQNRIFPLAVAWSLEHPDNPYYHDEEVLTAIAGGGEALVDAQDEQGRWRFDKKDGSYWGQIHMPWTYSRWVRAYQLVGDALPEESRERWKEGLLLGFKVMAQYFPDSGVHNIPTHRAMALYIAGECFGEQDWKDRARQFMAKAVGEQDPVGFWSEHSGPVVGYNCVYIDAMGIYFHHSQDPVVLDALERAARFHASILWPDGSAVAAIDERQIYHGGVRVGDVGFTHTPVGRGYMLAQLERYVGEDERLMDGDSAASMILAAGDGEVVMPEDLGEGGVIVLGEDDALIRRGEPWSWALSAYTAEVSDSRWIQDRHNLVDVFHSELEMVAGGGNTKLQPYWSTFTVGDPTLLSHTPGDESPDFTPDIDLLWVPTQAAASRDDEGTRLDARYRDVECSVEVRPDGDRLLLSYRAEPGKQVEGHLPLMMRGSQLQLASGEQLRLGDEPMEIGPDRIGEWLIYSDLKVTVPEGCSLLWPARQHNPYTKDGHSSLSHAKLVLVMPFEETDEHTVALEHQPPEPFQGLEFDARELPVEIAEGCYTKRLDGLGSQLLGGADPGDWITFTLPEVPAGRYELLGHFVLAYVYGIVEVLVDGERVGDEFDAWWTGVDKRGEIVSFGEVELDEGAHEVTVRVVGRGERAEDEIISVKRWLLRPLD